VGLEDLMEDGLASHSVLVSRLNDMFIKHLKTTWVPRTFQKLSEERKKLEFENAQLGMPPAHEPDSLPQVRDAVVQAVEGVLDRGVPSLLKTYSASVIQPMKKDIQGVVIQALGDAFPGVVWGSKIGSDRRCPISARVPLEHIDQVWELVPDVRTPLLNLVNSPQYSFDWCLSLRDLLCVENQVTVKPEWPSAEADQMLKNPPLLLTERFPSVVGGIIDEIKSDLKPKADALILAAVTRCVQRFSDEVACVEKWRKTSAEDGVFVEAVTDERLSEFSEELVLSFLRYNGAMLREMRARVRHVVERSSLIESCAEHRRDIISRQRAVERARDGMFELMGVHTPEERGRLGEEWEQV
jgi:hypothetical protein